MLFFSVDVSIHYGCLHPLWMLTSIIDVHIQLDVDIPLQPVRLMAGGYFIPFADIKLRTSRDISALFL
jgi:hypothetical protein